MMNKSLRGDREESSDNRQYGFRQLGPIDDRWWTPCGNETSRGAKQAQKKSRRRPAALKV